MDSTDRTEADRLSAVVLDAIDDEEAGAEDLARRAYWSRTHFFRLFRALVEETPGAMRRRLILERAAWQLSRTRLSVTEIAFDANYNSLEAFTRAFRKAFRVSPSLYRRMGASHIHLPASNGVHFCAPASQTEGALHMDLFDRFNGADAWHTRQLLKLAATLTDEQLDRPLPNSVSLLPWDKPERNIRELLENVVRMKEVWTAALAGADMPWPNGTPAEQRTPAAMLARFENSDGLFTKLLGDIRNRGGWDDTFVDALCEPPETFTFGGMFTHVITFNTYRRLSAMDALRRLGVKVEGMGCPTEYEAALSPKQSEHVGHNC